MSAPVITAVGFPVSNYYNKVKLILLEKGVRFEEELLHPKDFPESERPFSPLGKVPYIKTPHGALCESQVIAEYLEELYPEPRLLPADPWQRAKVRELATYVDLHLELVARQLYASAWFGGTLTDDERARIRAQLQKNIAGFQRLARFAPFVAGDTFTLADCAAYVSLPLVALATKVALGEDVLATAGVDWKSYVKLIEQRPTAQRVAADKKAALENT